MHKTWKKFVNINCSFCSNPFTKEKKEFDRQTKKNRNVKFYCSPRCLEQGSSLGRIIHKSIVKKCLICLKEFNSNTKPKSAKTCSSKCSHLLAESKLSPEQKLKRSELAKIRISQVKRIKKPPFKLKCIICNKEFFHKTQNIQTCSKECRSENMSRKAKANPNCGGETNYKRFKYKEITMDSSWEVELAQWMDDNNIKWIRDKKICLYWKDEKGDLRRYYPDFYLPDLNIYLDPKNKYLQEKDAFKLSRVKEHQTITLYTGYLDEIKFNIQNLMAGVPEVCL